MGKATRKTDAKTKKGVKRGTKSKSNRRRKKLTGSGGDDVVQDSEEAGKLYKSPRFKGYLTISLASVINYHAASWSTEPINVRLVPASGLQQAYAKTVSLVSAVITGLLVLIHLDQWFFRSFWRKHFGSPKSYLELGITIFLILWWFLAAIINTSVRGIAGDGKEQYNLYYSTWVCLWTSVWVLERKMVDFDLPTIRGFVTSWPYRAPGWIAIFFFSFFTLFWYVDLFANTYNQRDDLPDTLRVYWEDIPKSQYLWLLFVASITLLPSAIFIFLEVRHHSDSATTVLFYLPLLILPITAVDCSRIVRRCQRITGDDCGSLLFGIVDAGLGTKCHCCHDTWRLCQSAWKCLLLDLGDYNFCNGNILMVYS